MTTQTFKGKIAVIFGGTSGIGKAAARLLLEKGASVHIIGKHQLKVETAVAELKPVGEVNGYQTDIINNNQVNSFIDVIDRKFSKIDYLVNGSGIFTPEPFWTIPLKITMLTWI